MMLTAVMGALAILLIVAAVTDAMSYLIPNWISVALVVLFLVSAGLGGGALVSILPHIWTALATFAVGCAIFAFRLMGGGDVKLWAAIALWLGPDLILPHAVLVALLGGLFGVAIFAARLARERLKPRPTFSAVSKSPVPYGIAIAAAALVLLPQIKGVAPLH